MISKQGFIDMIKETGKGMAIDVARYSGVVIPGVWRGDETLGIMNYNTADFRKRDAKGYRIFIDYLNERNPPSDIQDILFRKFESGKREIVEEIPDFVAYPAVERLFYMQPIKTKVRLPKSAVEALHGLAQEPTSYEWGGGVDFEIILGKAQIERVLAYFGELRKVPYRVARKYDEDVEVIFHTHPAHKLALPSDSDIANFIQSKQQVDFIISRDQILILMKTARTPDIIGVEEINKRTPDIGYVRHTREDQMKDLREIEKEYHIKWKVIDYSADVEVDLNVIRKLAEEY